MFDLLLAICGAVLVIFVWVSVLRTTLMPRTSSSRMVRGTLRTCSAVATALARRLPAKPRARVLDLCVPVSLLVMAASWLVGLATGFTLLVVAFGDTGPGTASSGVGMTWGVVALVVGAGASAVLVAAAFVAYLVCFMNAHDRRERMIAQSAPQVQRVTDADFLIAHYVRAGSRDSLDRYFAQWAGWLADIHVSHVRYPGLVYHRSTGQLSWPKAAVAVMDAAAVVEAVAPRWAPVNTTVLLDVGSHCLQHLARQVGIVLPPMAVSLQGREEREFGDTMRLAVDSGLPAERDIDRACRTFQEIRVRYAPHAILLGSQSLICTK